ncbi:MAG: hypothetical protein ABI614_24560, partial [Planctomycetota bacterium]
ILALYELLKRSCRVIIAVDGTFDPNSHFVDFVNLIRNARWKYGVQITSIETLDEGSWKPLDVSSLVPDKASGLSKAHFVVARIQYPAEERDDEENHKPLEGFLIYLKPVLTGDEPIELQKYQTERPEFPNDPTLDQFFEPVRFESYRQLGEHSGDDLVAMLLKAATDDESWLSKWNPITSDSSVAESTIGAVPETLEFPLTSRLIDDLVKQLESADEFTRERIYGHLGDHGETLGVGLRRKIGKAMVARHALETEQQMRESVEKVLSTVGDGIPQVHEFFQRTERSKQKQTRAEATTREPKKRSKKKP